MYILGHDIKYIIYFELPSKVGKADMHRIIVTSGLTVPMGMRKQKINSLGWLLMAVLCSLSLMIDRLQVSVFSNDFSHPLRPVLKSINIECLLCVCQTFF